MDTTDTYDQMKATDLRAKLKSLGKSTRGNKSVLIHRLRTPTESADTVSDDAQAELELEINTTSLFISKDDYESRIKDNAIFDWSLRLLNSPADAEEEDIPMDIKLMTDNHPDLQAIQRLLLIIGTADLSPGKKPSPTSMTERLKISLSETLPSIEIVYGGTAEMLQDLGVKVSMEPNGMTDNIKMNEALSIIRQAIMSWLLATFQAHDKDSGSTFPDSFNPTERKQLRIWGRNWLKANNVDPSALSDDHITTAAADPLIPSERVLDSVQLVRTILRQICAELRRDEKAKKRRADARQGAEVDDDGEGVEENVNEGTAGGMRPKKRANRMVIEDSEEEGGEKENR